MEENLVSTTRLRALRSGLGSGDKPILIATHDYPDPDAIASAMAFQTLAGSWGVSSVIVHGGIIGREENAEMVRLLKIDLTTYDSIARFEDFRGALFLDTQPQARNQSMPHDVPVLGIIDHHRLGEDSIRSMPLPRPLTESGTTRITYNDIRLDVGATSTLAFGYLESAGIMPDTRLATALFIGIKTATDGFLRDANPADIDAYTRLMPLSDLKLAARILHPPLDRDYFRFLHLAMERAVIYDYALVSNCGDVDSPDMLSSASDTLIDVREVDYALAVGFYQGRAYMSLRANPPHEDATRVMLRVIGEDGKGGGHNRSAGGFTDIGPSETECFEAIRLRFLAATGVSQATGVSLI